MHENPLDRTEQSSSAAQTTVYEPDRSLKQPAPADLPTIAAIETVPIRLAMHGALRWGSASSLAELHHVLVRLTLSDGSFGVAEAPVRPTIYGETVASICAIVHGELAPRLLGMCAEPGHALSRMHEIANNQTARGAIDMALHSALAQHAGISLAEEIGAVQKQVRVSYILGIGEQDALLEEAERVYAQGVRVLKVKVGRDWAAELALIDALRTHFDGAMALYADANQCLTQAEAGAKLQILRERELLYCEEPLPCEQITARAALRRRQIIPLIGDDSCFSLRDVQRELALDTFDILNIKTARSGFTESAAMQQCAADAGKGIMIGSQASAGLGTLHAALFAARSAIEHPSELSFVLKLSEDILQRPLTFHDGFLNITELADAAIDPDRIRAASGGAQWQVTSSW